MAATQYFFSPGPTKVPHRVACAESRAMVSHRSSDFMDVFEEMTRDLQEVFQTQHDLLTLTCSGTGAMDATVANFLNPGDKALVLSSGNFGSRFRDICQSYGVDAEYMEFPWGEAVDPEAVRRCLAQDEEHKIKAVLMQHNETSTGVFNPVEAVSRARGAHPAILIVDSISGMAAVPLKTDEWNLDVVIAASQKAFMTPPGLSFISVSPKAWEVQAASTQPKYYFDLANARKYLAKRQTPATPAVSLIYAMGEALKMLKETGLEQVLADHAFRRDLLRAGIQAMGLEPLAKEDCASPAITAIYAPPGIEPGRITKLMSRKYQAAAAGGMGRLKDTTFRMGHLGYMADLDIVGGLAALEMALLECGHKLELGAGAGAAQKLMMERYRD